MLLQFRPGAGRPPPLHPIVRETPRVLHVTNGDGAASRLRAAGASGDVLPWRDALHEGPVPPVSTSRSCARSARAIASRGWEERSGALEAMTRRDERLAGALAAGEEIVLWFESDLYDVLQLAQILDRVESGRARLVLVGVEEFAGVAELPERELQRLMHGDDTVREDEVAAARALWDAFRAPEPHALHALPQRTVFGAAARRHLQQFPWAGDGLNRSERALLQAVADGAGTPAEAFLAAQARRSAPSSATRSRSSTSPRSRSRTRSSSPPRAARSWPASASGRAGRSAGSAASTCPRARPAGATTRPPSASPRSARRRASGPSAAPRRASTAAR